MTDIVKRLRTLHRHEAAELAMLDAATEIEGLRNDLATERERGCAQDLSRQIRRATTTGGAYSCATVIAAILAVDAEAAHRGEMFPQTADEQREDRKAVGRVVAMLMWYEKNTGCARLTGWPRSQE